MWSWPEVVPLLATRCLYQGLIPEVKSTGPNLVPFFTTRWHHWGYIWAQVNHTQLSTNLGHYMPLLGVHLTTGQPDPMAAQMLNWAEEVPFLATRCQHWGYIWAQVNQTLFCTTLGHQIPVPGGTSELRSTGPNVKLTWSSTTLGHQMLLLGVCLSSGQLDPTEYQLLATRCWYQGGPSDLSTKRTSENLNTLCVSGLSRILCFLFYRCVNADATMRPTLRYMRAKLRQLLALQHAAGALPLTPENVSRIYRDDYCDNISST